MKTHNHAINKKIRGPAPARKQSTPASLPLPDRMVLYFDTDLKSARRVQASFKRAWSVFSPSVKQSLAHCWKGKTSVLIPGMPDEWIAPREIPLEKAPYLAVLESLPSARLLSFDCSASCALLWHAGAVRLMKPRTLDVFIAENILSAFIRGKGGIPKPATLSRLLKKYAHLDYALLHAWGEEFRTEIRCVLDRQHPSRLVTPELVFLLKTGRKPGEPLSLEEEGADEEESLFQQEPSEADPNLPDDPLAGDPSLEDDVSPEINRLLDQYEEPAEEEAHTETPKRQKKSQK